MLHVGGTYFDVRGELGRNERCTIYFVTHLVTVELKEILLNAIVIKLAR